MAARRISKSSSVGEELDEIEFEVCSAACIAATACGISAHERLQASLRGLWA